MEGLLIFIIFIVFQLVKSMGGAARPPGTGPISPPVQPMRPARPGTPLPRPHAWPPQYDNVPITYDEPPESQTTEPERETRKKPKAAETTQGKAEYTVFRSAESDEGVLRLEADAVVLGVIFSEVLGAPRAKKPWQLKL